MKNKKLWIGLSFLIILIPLAVGLLLWNQLPDPMPTHWDAHGQINGYSSKPFGVLFLPLFMTGIQIFVLLVCFMDPKGRKQIESSKVVFFLVISIIPATAVFAALLTYGTVLGWKINVSMVTQIFLGIVYLVIGNYLPKIQQNYTVGVRLPWTLESKNNWKKTNRVAGFIFVLSGILFVLNGVFQVINLLALVLGSTLVILVGIGVFSAMEYKKEVQLNEEDDTDGKLHEE